MTQNPQAEKRARIVSLVVRYKCASLGQFIVSNSADMCREGLFVKSATPFAVSTTLRFELRLSDNTILVAGVGRVVWRREPADAKPDMPAGMGIAFVRIEEAHQAAFDRIVTEAPNGGGLFRAGTGSPSKEKGALSSVPSIAAEESPPAGEAGEHDSTRLVAVPEATPNAPPPLPRMKPLSAQKPVSAQAKNAPPSAPASDPVPDVGVAAKPPSGVTKARPGAPDPSVIEKVHDDDEPTDDENDRKEGTMIMPTSAYLQSAARAPSGEIDALPARSAFGGPSVGPIPPSDRHLSASGPISGPMGLASGPHSVHSVPMPVAPPSGPLSGSMQAWPTPHGRVEVPEVAPRKGGSLLTVLLAAIALLLVLIVAMLVGGGVFLFKNTRLPMAATTAPQPPVVRPPAEDSSEAAKPITPPSAASAPPAISVAARPQPSGDPSANAAVISDSTPSAPASVVVPPVKRAPPPPPPRVVTPPRPVTPAPPQVPAWAKD
jgi:hypothetical protein